MATNRPAQVNAFFENLRVTAEDQSSFEVLIRADEGDEATIDAIMRQKELSQFRIHLLVEKNQKGTFMLHHAYNRLTKESASSSVYFFWNLTDEIRIHTQGWDRILKSYVKLYPDDLFRLKPTLNNINNYYNFSECLPLPDNYSLFTRRWMELVDGWGDYWGTDSWHQCIDWYLGQCRIPAVPHAVFRSVPIFSIALDGQGSGEVLSAGQSAERRKMMAKQSFKILMSFEARENFNRLAKRMHAHYIAKNHGLNSYIIREDRSAKRMIVIAPDNRVIDVLGWNLRFDPFKNWLVTMAFRHLNEKTASLVVEGTKRIASRSKNVALAIIRLMKRTLKALAGALKQPPGIQDKKAGDPEPVQITEYHFHEGENKFFPSDYEAIRKRIDAL